MQRLPAEGARDGTEQDENNDFIGNDAEDVVADDDRSGDKRLGGGNGAAAHHHRTVT